MRYLTVLVSHQIPLWRSECLVGYKINQITVAVAFEFLPTKLILIPLVTRSAATGQTWSICGFCGQRQVLLVFHVFAHFMCGCACTLRQCPCLPTVRHFPPAVFVPGTASLPATPSLFHSQKEGFQKELLFNVAVAFYWQNTCSVFL